MSTPTCNEIFEALELCDKDNHFHQNIRLLLPHIQSGGALATPALIERMFDIANKDVPPEWQPSQVLLLKEIALATEKDEETHKEAVRGIRKKSKEPHLVWIAQTSFKAIYEQGTSQLESIFISALEGVAHENINVRRAAEKNVYAILAKQRSYFGIVKRLVTDDLKSPDLERRVTGLHILKYAALALNDRTKKQDIYQLARPMLKDIDAAVRAAATDTVSYSFDFNEHNATSLSHFFKLFEQETDPLAKLGFVDFLAKMSSQHKDLFTPQRCESIAHAYVEQVALLQKGHKVPLRQVMNVVPTMPEIMREVLIEKFSHGSEEERLNALNFVPYFVELAPKRINFNFGYHLATMDLGPEHEIGPYRLEHAVDVTMDQLSTQSGPLLAGRRIFVNGLFQGIDEKLELQQPLTGVHVVMRALKPHLCEDSRYKALTERLHAAQYNGPSLQKLCC